MNIRCQCNDENKSGGEKHWLAESGVLFIKIKSGSTTWSCSKVLMSLLETRRAAADNSGVRRRCCAFNLSVVTMMILLSLVMKGFSCDTCSLCWPCSPGILPLSGFLSKNMQFQKQDIMFLPPPFFSPHFFCLHDHLSYGYFLHLPLILENIVNCNHPSVVCTEDSTVI